MSPLLETMVVSRTELLRNLRNARVLVLLLLFATSTALIGLVVGLLTRGLDAQGPEAAAAASAGILGFLAGEDGAAFQRLSELPLLVPLVFRAALFFLPLFIALLGYDQLSAELSTGSIRYLGVRARRGSILAGKFLAQAVVLGVLLALVLVGLFVAGASLRPGLEPLPYAEAAARFWVGGTTFAFGYLALTALSSAVTTGPGSSLLLNVGALFVFWLLDAIGGRAALVHRMGGPASWTEALRWLSPSAYASGVLGSSSALLTSAAAYAVFGTVFLAGAWAAFRVRDL
ncbi:MAG TPA: ABC transporter permease subunit [Myxococcaceae bacterium]|nr:ABC transporter permease subunit [Myxococcaceae bacterium]